ncbi:MAG: ACP phosphodiesterase [Armatimonas sp.]
MPGAPAAFFTGNVLPDLVGQVGHNGLRRESVAGKVGPVADGIRLHLDTDRRFHTDLAFLDGCQRAGALLRSAVLNPPPRRVFFLAHVAYELALDAVLLENSKDLADDLYKQLVQGKSAALEFLGDTVPLHFVEHYDSFIEHGYLRHYTRLETLSRALRGIARRVATDLLPDSEESVAKLEAFFVALRETIEPEAEELLLRVGGTWYNSLQVAAYADDY